jgi:hypothetical protein
LNRNKTLNNPWIFSAEKQETRLKRISDSQQSKKNRKSKEKGIIHLKKKSLHKAERVKKIKKKSKNIQQQKKSEYNEDLGFEEGKFHCLSKIGSVDSLSAIRDPEGSIKIEDLDIEGGPRFMEENTKSLDNSGLQEESDISQYFMINPMTDKPSPINFNSKGKSSDGYGTTIKEWTMDIPKIKWPTNDRLSDNSEN